MDLTIALFLVQDGLINGAIYTLLAIALLLVFTVTRIILIPQGEFVAFAALTQAAIEAGRVPGTAYLLATLGALALILDVWRVRGALTPRTILHLLFANALLPAALFVGALLLAPLKPGLIVSVPLTLALVVALGPPLYRIAFQPLAEASILVLLIAAIGVHIALTALGLIFFGPEGYRTTALTDGSFTLGPLLVSGQSLVALGTTIVALLALYVFFERTLVGKALRASAVNRTGARLVGIPTRLSGTLAFVLAAFIGALSGVLIAPSTTLYYDSGFIIGLKGFVAAILGGLSSYPATAASALLVGLIESFSSFWASAFKEVIVFTVIIPVLFWRSLKRRALDEEE